MLEMGTHCERCEKDLPAEAAGARICSFECTCCALCVEACEVCPNCAGELLPRPRRAAHLLTKFPPLVKPLKAR